MRTQNTACNRFPFSNFRHSLTLFSKFFASFPHGTCSLSDSRRYLALDEIYHLINAPIPGNATLRLRTLRSTAQVLNWAVTIRCISFQKTYTCRAASHASRYYNAKHEALLLDMSSSFFIRHYLKNPLSFLFHHLLICLNSEGNFSETGLWNKIQNCNATRKPQVRPATIPRRKINCG